MSTEKLAQGLASLGRGGDSILVHMQPHEVAGLQAIAEANGTSLTVNPHTGMPEAFSLGGVFEALAPMAVGAALGPAGFGLVSNPLTAGLITGALTTAMTGDVGQGIMGGLGGYGGFGLGDTLSKAGGIGAEMSRQGVAGNEMMNAVTSGVAPGTNAPQAAGLTGGFDASGMYNAAMPSPEALQSTIGNINQYGPMTGSGFENALSGAKNMFTPEGRAAFTAAGGSTMDLAMPAITGALGGLEESDIYGKPLTNPNDVYDPYARLNLAGASSKGGSGLRLLAGGGPISFASGAMVGGGTGAMQGAGSYNVDTQQPNQPMAFTNAQNHLLGGAYGNSAYVAGQQYQNPVQSRGMAGKGYNPQAQQVEPTKIGLFATQAQIDAAKNRANLNRPMSDPRKSYYGFGMYNNGNYGMGGWQNPNGFAGIGSLGRMPMGAPTNEVDVRPGSLNLSRLPASRLAAGGLAELSAQTQGVQPQQQQPQANTYQSLQPPAPQSTLTTGGNFDLYENRDGVTQQISRGGFGLTNQPAIMQQGYAKGGELEEGAFIIPADVVSHLGNGSTDAGLAILSKHYGAKPIRGPGDGMSDSIPTSIEGRQEARVADGEAYIPKAVVMREGGAAKFHKMMNRVRKERTGSAKQGKKINPDKLV